MIPTSSSQDRNKINKIIETTAFGNWEMRSITLKGSSKTTGIRTKPSIAFNFFLIRQFMKLIFYRKEKDFRQVMWHNFRPVDNVYLYIHLFLQCKPYYLNPKLYLDMK